MLSTFQWVRLMQPETSRDRLLCPYDIHDQWRPRREISFRSELIQQLFQQRQIARNAQIEAAEKYQQAQVSADGKIHLPVFKES